MDAYASEHFEITLRGGESCWLCRRTDKPFDSVQEVRDEIAKLDALMARHDTSKAALLVDLRATRGRNDPEMEAELAGLRRLFHRHFAYVGNLVNTAVGKMHLERLARQDGLNEAVFRDETQALDWLRSPQSCTDTPG